ncbi:MAG: CDP-alcohol phosphatidyltransferase family protein [Candidatus Colwellbacteria bacterium]|jgi:cardiolipin synthase|nr:CDP-alcohol phosphatidyltransferase family protein [Candidatus Colwellbacteria bacterium]MCK9497423.1 CDP-alcohol phosphatidyltransferase family protein [Candidatus Colwellbacteria bacterium]
MVPIFLYTFLVVKDQNTALLMFLVAEATDILDGYIARKTSSITDFGKAADPLADKLITLAALFSLAHIGYLPSHFFLIYLFLSAFLLSGSILIISGKLKRIELKAQFIGKLAAMFTFIGIFLSFIPNTSKPWNIIIMWIAAITSTLAFGYYIKRYRKHIKSA